jgi:DNA gyrase subunit A
VTDVRDESDRDNGMRLVIETGRGHDPKDVFEILLKRTEMRTSISYNAVGVASSGEGDYPVENMKLRFMLEQFVLHRINVIIRRSKYELEKAQKRLHIVEGLLKALDALDEVIKIVRNAETSEIASQQLQKRLHIDDVQAQAILDMQIRHLARLNVKKLKDEASDLKKRITELKAIIGSESKQLEVIVAETKEVKEQFATPRRTTIVDSVANGVMEEVKKKKVAPVKR